jgi:hypothetical protein
MILRHWLNLRSCWEWVFLAWLAEEWAKTVVRKEWYPWIGAADHYEDSKWVQFPLSQALLSTSTFTSTFKGKEGAIVFSVLRYNYTNSLRLTWSPHRGKPALRVWIPGDVLPVVVDALLEAGR